MALRINTNIAAINAHRQLLGTEKALNNNIERLSSGYRINRASDDAAGLSIANRLRTNVRSLTVASRNATEARSLVSVAEGAANNLEGILERLKELATQAASDNAAGDRTKINAEASKLIEELDRIVNATNYQGASLLKGSFGNAISTLSAMSGTGLVTASFVGSGAAAGSYTFNAVASGAKYNVSLTDGNNVTQTISVYSEGAQTLNFDKIGIVINAENDFSAAGLDAETVTVTAGGCGGIFQVGSGSAFNIDTIGINLGDLRATTLNLTAVSLTSSSDARSAMSTIDSAIDIINSVLGDIGATMNRLDYTYANIQVSVENFQASQSVIRDVDMADEMTSFTKNQILLQAGTAMLAQANMSSQGVLTLMR